MNKTFFYLAVATIFFVACSKDEPTDNDSNSFVLEATNVNVSVNIASVKAIINALKPGPNDNPYWESYWVNNEITSGKFENGGFKLIFPKTIPEEYLGSMYELFNIFSYEGITVSDRQVKTGSILIYAYDNAGNYAGNFKLVSDGWYTEFMYADRSFTEKGKYQSGSESDCTFHKGLNTTYVMWGGNTKSTTQKPQNETFKWILSPPPSVGLQLMETLPTTNTFHNNKK